MSYTVAISRGYQWAEDGSFQPIPLSEWHAAIISHGLVPSEFQTAINPETKESIRINTPNAARIGRDGALLTWKKGIIEISACVDQHDLCRPIAQTLGARLYGEEGEEY